MTRLSELKTFDEVLDYVEKFPERQFSIQYQRTKDQLDFESLFNKSHLIFERFEFLDQHYKHDLRWCNFVYDTIIKILKVDPDVVVNLIKVLNEKKTTFENKILSIDLSKPRIKNIEYFQIVTSKRGQKTISFDYHEIENELEKLYGFSFRSIYPDFWTETLNQILKSVYNISSDEIKSAQTVAPNTGNFVADLICVFRFFVGDVTRTYLDFWDHLLDFDFVELKRGGLNSMARTLDDWEDDSIHPILLKIREIYNLECPIDKSDYDDEYISFHVDW
jgi:hypothetical protein